MRRSNLSVMVIVMMICSAVSGLWIFFFAETVYASVMQTPVEKATFSFKDGVPVKTIEGVGDVQDIGAIAPYVLHYMGEESYQPKGGIPPQEYSEAKCIQWIKDNAENVRAEVKGWSYSFDNTYNDVTIYAPWYSAFGQACGIEALAAWYRRTGDAEALEIAKQAAQLLFLPIEDGGLLFSHGDDIWFEEVPRNENGVEPSHILNGHMRALLALHKLYDTCGDKELLKWYDRGVASLLRWLPAYDTGYWLRYDLNPKKKGLLFRFNEPNGGVLPALALDEIRLEDPASGKSVVIDAGAAGDMKDTRDAYLAGIDWQAESILDGHNVRRLLSVTPVSDVGVFGAKPNSYFYLKLPAEWNDNLRKKPWNMVIKYKDEAPGTIVIEQRSIAPDEEFVAMRNGTIVLKGDGKWRIWRFAMQPQDIGWPVGVTYAEKHAQYIEALARYSPKLAVWADKAKHYLNTVQARMDMSVATHDS